MDSFAYFFLHNNKNEIEKSDIPTVLVLNIIAITSKYRQLPRIIVVDIKNTEKRSLHWL